MSMDGFLDFMCKALLVGATGILIWCALSIASKSRQEKAQLERYLLEKPDEPKEDHGNDDGEDE